MKKFLSEFIFRGLVACGIGPIILAIVYLILQGTAGLEVLTVSQVCIGIFSLAALSFLAGGLNALYQIEQLPLMVAILIHGGALYVGYLITYLLNDWLEKGLLPILIFTVIFVVGYLLIWAIIYIITRHNTKKINAALLQRHNEESLDVQ